jgi:hypothetical protein
MNFQQARNYLTTVFNQNGFSQNVQNKNIHATQVVVETCSNGTEISVSFPGYKAYITGNKTVYDYRVDIVKNGIKTALSHTNIITDIYNKIDSCNMSASELRNVLIEVSQEGNIMLQSIVQRLPYNPSAPNQNLLTRVANAHNGKTYNAIGNSFDLTLEELLSSIKWIVLQEDINYPISNGYEGRKMPFARYLEAIFVTQNTSHTLEEVIQRALSHSRPSQWNEMDYSFRNQVR